MNTKLCGTCNVEKPATLDYFYKHASSKDNLDRQCKDCKIKYSRNRFHTKTRKSNQYEEMLVHYLLSNGVFAGLGKDYKRHKWVDVIAWGCVGIELKSSPIVSVGSDHYKFEFTARQKKRGILGDLVCLHTRDTNEFHFFDKHFPLFYMDGRLKTGFTFYRNPKQRMKADVLTSEIMGLAKDHLYLIEQARITKARKKLNVFVSEAKPKTIQLPLFNIGKAS